jgi:hypothetical protein
MYFVKESGMTKNVIRITEFGGLDLSQQYLDFRGDNFRCGVGFRLGVEKYAQSHLNLEVFLIAILRIYSFLFPNQQTKSRIPKNQAPTSQPRPPGLNPNRTR